MDGKINKFDLEDRLVDFASICLEVCDILPNSKAGQNLEYKLSKSAKIDMAFEEASQLMAIFLKSIETARENNSVNKK